MTALTAALVPTVALFREWGQPFALIGGAAMVARGRTRFTNDLDVTFALAAGQEQIFLLLAKRHGFSWLAADERLFVEAGLLRATAANGVTVDFMTASEPLYEAAANRATPVDIEGTSVPVATPEDLVLMKLEANRGIDLDDAIALKDIYGASLDRAYLKQAASGAGLLSRVENLLGALG